MRSFGREEWAPSGSRWITQARLGEAARDLGDAYAEVARSWCASRVGGIEVLRIVGRPWRHITLSLVDIPAVAVPEEQVERLRAALAERVAGLPPFELTCGPAIVNTVALELYLAPSPALADLQARVAEAYASVFPGHDPAPVGKRFRGHSAIAYCTRDFDDEGLASALLRTPGEQAGYRGTVTTVVDHVVLAPTDAWSPHGMWWDQARTWEIPLGGAGSI